MSRFGQYDGLERNPDACCGNCEYGLCGNIDGDEYPVECRHTTAEDNWRSIDGWCGEHPHFWRIAKDTPPMTEQESITEAARRG